MCDVTGINSAIVRGLCKVIGTTLTKYKDPKSQQLVKDLIVSLASQHSDLTFDHFNAVLKTIISKDLAGFSALKSSQAAVIALNWSILLGLHVNRTSDVGKTEFKKLAEYQAALYQFGISGSNERVTERAIQLVETFFVENDDIELEYFDVLVKLEPSSSVVLFLFTIVEYRWSNDANDDLLQRHKTALIDHFIKGLITVKVKPHSSLYTSCAQLLRALSSDEFQTSILPALQRAMLRSPEVILQGVGTIIHELNFDCSSFAFDLGKTLITNLYSKDELARKEAVESMREISTKCSDANAIRALAKQVFDVLNGCDGKITVAEFRMNLLQVSFFS